MIPAPNQPAPDFAVLADDGSTVRLGDYRGRTVVLFFYPKDDTTGCTAEACSLRDEFPRFTGLDAIVLGVSPDDVKSHVKFKEKYQLPFTLLADTSHEVAEKYGVWQEKSMYGRKYMGNARTTFIIGPDGRIARVFEKVKPEGHGEEVAAAVKELQS